MAFFKTISHWVKKHLLKKKDTELQLGVKDRLECLMESGFRNSRNARLLGCKPDKPDNRDHIKLCASVYNDTISGINEFSLRKYAPPVQNQKDTSACTGFAGAASVFILLKKMAEHSKSGDEAFLLSPLYIYYNARFIDFMFKDQFYGKTTSPLPDQGATLRSLMQGLKKYGVIPESYMPFYKFNPSSNPPSDITADLNFKIHEYLRIDPNNDPVTVCKNVLVSEHLPIIAGIYLYDEQMDYFDYYGYLTPCEDIESAELIGGHAICITGFRQHKGETYFEFINSWGTSTGDFGYGYLPASFLADSHYVMDMWTFDKSYF